MATLLYLYLYNLNTLYLHARSLEEKIFFGIRIHVVKVILKRVFRNYKKF